MTTAPDPRAELARLIEERGTSARSLSLLLGRNDAYIHQHLNRGTPRVLPETDRLALAQHFQIDERRLGARDPWTPVGAAE